MDKLSIDVDTYEPYIVTMTPYRMEVAIIWSPDEQQALAEWLRRRGDKWVDWGDFVSRAEWNCYGMSWVGKIDDLHVLGVNLPLAVREKRGLSEVMATIAHEASHIMASLCDIIGYRPDRDHDEPYAYALGYLVQHAVSCIPAELPDAATAVKRAARKKS